MATAKASGDILFGNDGDAKMLFFKDNMKVDFNKTVMGIECKNLKDIVLKLKIFKKKLSVLKQGNIVLVIGNTGSGKSTMLSSLIYGPQSLRLKEIE